MRYCLDGKTNFDSRIIAKFRQMAKGNRKSKTKTTRPKKGHGDDSSGGSDPDMDSDSYYQDDVDKFHTDRDQILLDSGAKLPSAELSSGEDEVLAFDDDDDDEDDGQYQEMKQRLHKIRAHGRAEAMASDLEDEDDTRTKPGKSEKAWGSSRSKFYGGHDSDLDEDLSGSEPEADALEEEEALAVQKRLLAAIDEDDVGLGIIKTTPTAEEISSEKITQDLSKLSKREKLKLLRKQSPELLELIQDFKTRMDELQKRLLPVMKLIRNHRLPASSSGAKLVETKTKLYLNYLVNVSFYLMLKAKQTSVENHPVIKRLVQYRNLMKQMDKAESKLQPEVDSILKRLADGEEFPTVEEEPEQKSSAFKSVLLNKKRPRTGEKRKANTKRLSELMGSSDSEEELPTESDPLQGGHSWGRKKHKEEAAFEEDLSGAEDEGEEEMMEDAEAGENERRGINYQIEKNKGLTTKKRKELRNPRVKHKLKYRKAKIRRKGQVREVRTEVERYGGEISGIRAGIIRSTRLK